jgi:hypothetical protein
VTCRSVLRTARRTARSTGSSPWSSYGARALRASFCEGGSQSVTSCAPHPKPATKLLDSHYRSDRGACGFVLTHDGHGKYIAGTDGSRLYFNFMSPTSTAQVAISGGETASIPVGVPGFVPSFLSVSPDGSSFLIRSIEDENDVLWECPHFGRLVSQAWRRVKQWDNWYLLSRWEFRGLRHIRRRALDRKERWDRSSQASLGRFQGRRTYVVARRPDNPGYARRKALGDQFEWIELFLVQSESIDILASNVTEQQRRVRRVQPHIPLLSKLGGVEAMEWRKRRHIQSFSGDTAV